MSAHSGSTTVSTDYEIGPDFEFALGRLRAYAAYAAAPFEQAGYFSLHSQTERAVALALAH